MAPGRSLSQFTKLCALATASVLVANCGGGGGETNGGLPRLALFAGNLGGQGNSDGVGVDARFTLPRGVATDLTGNVYVADTGNSTIRRITPEGVVTTIAGQAGVVGNADGPASEARFWGPIGIGTDSAGNIYIGDTYLSTIRKVTFDAQVSTLARGLWNPSGVATDSAGNVFVADTYNHVIRKISPTGAVSTLAGAVLVRGSADGGGAAARFYDPSGVAVDSANNLYVADTLNHTIRKITPEGIVSTLAGSPGVSGSVDGHGTIARFFNPFGITVDSAGNVYVADTMNRTVRKISPDGAVSTLAGSAGEAGAANGSGTNARFMGPTGISMDRVGRLYVADASTIRKIDASGWVSTLAGQDGASGSDDGYGAAARFNGPSGISVDTTGTVYLADSQNQKLRRITPDGAVTSLLGTTGPPNAITTDRMGNVYFANEWGTIIQRLARDGTVSNIAGSGLNGIVDGTGSAAQFRSIVAMTTDGLGNVYATDWTTIRKITPAGVVTTVAGKDEEWGSSDGIGTAARFSSPWGIATDGVGNLYIADSGNFTVRKISPEGVVTTLAGTAGMQGSADGIGAAARFSYVYGVATDEAGNVYVADLENHTIRKITSAGVVTTVVGVAGRIGFTPGALPGALCYPMGIALSGRTLYITFLTYDGVAVVTNLP